MESVWMECPECHTNKGLYVEHIVPHEGEFVWQCKCDGDIFYITPAGIFCVNCGWYQTFGGLKGPPFSAA